MEVPTTRPSLGIPDGSVTERERHESPPLITETRRESPPLTAETRRESPPLTAERDSLAVETTRSSHEVRDMQLVRGRRETVLDSYRESPPLITETRRESPPLTAQRDSLAVETTRHSHDVRDSLTVETRSSHEVRDSLAVETTRSSHEVRDLQLARGRRETVLDSYRDGLTTLREESARGGYERAWNALSGYERTPSPSYEGSPHPISGYERLSVERAHTMKDFEKQITELKKENFNLKLRIYFLEEQVQRRCDTSSDELHRMNIELKVEVESLKHDYQEKQNLLVRASKAMESLAGERELEVQRLREDHLKHLEDLEDAHRRKLQLLESDIEHEKAELEKICVLLDQERIQRFTAEERLMALNEQYTKSMGILEERDWIIQCLNDTVHSKDALIAQLEKQISSMMTYEASGDKTGKNISNLYLEGDTKDLPELAKPTCGLDRKVENTNEWQEKIKEMDNLINELQQKLEANKAGLAAEEKNSLKRDKAIQGLSQALKKKTKENEKLLSEIDNLNAALSKAREAAQQAQLQNVKENIHPKYKKLIFTLQAEQDMYSRLLNYERESGSLQKELESIAMLRRWLEENIQANQELRKTMEAQIMARYKGDDSMSFLGDQTSYMSICLDHLDQNEYFFAGGPQETAFCKNNLDDLFKYPGKEMGTQTHSEVSVSSERHFKHQQDCESGQSFSERGTLQEEDGENDAKLSRNKPNMVSTSTQTDLSTLSDKCFTRSRSPDEKGELMWTLEDGEHSSSMRLPQKRSNTCESQEYNFNRNAKKSRLPVLLKSSLNTRLKTDVALAKEDDHNCLEKDLQVKNCHPFDQLKCSETESPKELQDPVHHMVEQNTSGQGLRNIEKAMHKELQSVNYGLSEESQQTESESFANKDLWRCKDSTLYNSEQRDSTVLQELLAENYRLSQQLRQAQMKIEKLEANGDFTKCKISVPDSEKSTGQALQKGLFAENHSPSDQLKEVELENKNFNTNEELLKSKAYDYDLSESKDEQKMLTEQALQKDLQTEHYQLYKLQIREQIETETIQGSAEWIKHKEVLLDLSGSVRVQTKPTDQELQGENYRLSEELKQSQMEIEKLKAKELLTSKPSELDSFNSKDELRKLAEQTFQLELQAENYHLSEQLKQAQMVIETMKANERLMRSEFSKLDLHNSNDEWRKLTEQAFQKELQTENCHLSEQLKQAQIEIETLKANEELLSSEASKCDLHNSNAGWRKLTEQASQNENCDLSEQLKQAQIEIETLKANEKLRSEIVKLDMHKSNDEWRKLTEQAIQKELQAENYHLSEQLKQALMEIETLKANEELLRSEASKHNLHNSNDEWRKSTDQALQKELQAENYRLFEQLKQAQVEIETLKASEELIKHKNVVPGIPYSFKESPDRSLQKELQAEQCRLSERLKTAQMEIEELKAERRSTGSSNDSLKLHGSDADDDLSEQSFLEKTITNSVNVIEVDATSDFGDEVCRPDVISHNAVALRCHHDSHCTECANNRGSLPLPTSKTKRVSTRHSSSQFTKASSRRSFEDTTSLSKYDLLVQSQARELSLQRQKIKESHNLSVICSKNFYNILKAFENLIPASTLDSNITLGFQEQITQTVEWLKELEYKLSDALYGEEDAYSDHSADSLLYTPSRLVPGHRMWADKHGCHVLGLVEDYNALRKQILEAGNVLQEMEAFIDHGVQTAVLNMAEHFGNIFFEKLTRTKQSLEEAGCLLKLLWRVSLPLQIHSPYSINHEEEVNLEVTRLRKRVIEQEKLLSGMVKRVYSENQMKEDIEKLILDQLAMTHDILKRAKGNLEVQVVDKLQ